MPQQPTLFPKLHVSTRPPESLSATTAMSSFTGYGPPSHAVDTSTHHQIFRTKRKHVLKACDRCRCDGNQPCYRCEAYNHPCLFRERKATQTKAYSRGFVEMLESHHALVVKALQQLYAHCVKNECFPGEPIAEVVDGYPLTHAILDRLGLIKQAEEETAKGTRNSPEPLQCWGERPRSADSTDTDGVSSAQTCSLELSPSSEGASVSPSELESVKIEPSVAVTPYAYDVYHDGECLFPPELASHGPQALGFNHELAATGFRLNGEYFQTHTGDMVETDSGCSATTALRSRLLMAPQPYVHHIAHGPYFGVSNVSNFPFPDSNHRSAETENYSWPPTMWNR
ncbi:hypothetical protein AJ80_00088 [Polytolypa hystricis UAMH7299]|uniref:Zn(2)-C6 fungal-type domain-containing protein n=1 Tax=Polytolypa hystricis (strain UAMH7299) TaxID=1447883 RepID=A0A2B7Z4Z2_POLH7|nr:hypothetical protein AJ80_00088 [Polytolypa hystricis UAMH7299]